MAPWKTHSRKTVLTCGKWLSVEDRTVETPTGQVIEHWSWVISPDYINVLAVDELGRYLVFRQGKYALEGESFAPIGGYVEPGEDPHQAARRELLEETGYESADWIHLGRFQVDPNRGVAVGDLFLARGAHQVTDPTADDLEEQVLLHLSRSELLSALQSGQFKVLAWAANVALALASESGNPADG
jgi:ADP-ribose pyrophosphatase